MSAASAAPPDAPQLKPGANGLWRIEGNWTAQGLGKTPPPTTASTEQGAVTTLDGSALTALDTVGAWALRSWLHKLKAKPSLQAWPPQALALLERLQASPVTDLLQEPHVKPLARLGLLTQSAGQQALDLLSFVGALANAGLRQLRKPAQMPWRALFHEIQTGGFDALPIIGLTAFLLGVVVAYQGADQLQHYGANIFVVELVGYAMLREFAPLIAAIIVAGRSGSAFTAQLGTMQVNEEIDALRTLGIDPLQRLVLPKLLALLVALPLLTLFADAAGVLGGMVMAQSQLGIGFHEFLARFGRVMQGSALLLGLGKSVVFALIIATVGCFQGLRTGSSADSVGRQTTLSVVQASFLVIVVDALFSVIFNVLKL
jgi:phospholipid/cholesterol/gamma-HCH transport system permease protein